MITNHSLNSHWQNYRRPRYNTKKDWRATAEMLGLGKQADTLTIPAKTRARMRAMGRDGQVRRVQWTTKGMYHDVHLLHPHSILHIWDSNKRNPHAPPRNKEIVNL